MYSQQPDAEMLLESLKPGNRLALVSLQLEMQQSLAVLSSHAACSMGRVRLALEGCAAQDHQEQSNFGRSQAGSTWMHKHIVGVVPVNVCSAYLYVTCL